MIKKIYTKMHSEKCYVKLKLNKLKDFIQSDLFKKILSEEMQEIKIAQSQAMEAYVAFLDEALTQMIIENPQTDFESEKSMGELIIGSFNSGEKAQAVDEIKLGAINLINDIDDLGKDGRRKAIAFTDIEKGTIMAVKSLLN